MGVMKFRLPSNEPAQRLPDYRKAYITGLDRTPGRLAVELRNGLMTCVRDTPESGRLFVPWPVQGHGTPFIGTATLAERNSPYMLAVELARGKLNDVRNQVSDWVQMGLRTTSELDAALADAQEAFVRCVTLTDRPEACIDAARASLESASHAGDLVVDAYTAQILQSRLASTSRLATHLACVLDVPPQQLPATTEWSSTFNMCHLSATWKQIAPSEGQYRWDLLDAQLSWCRSKGLTFEVGPLIEFRQGCLPDWVWLFEADCDTISGLAADFVREVVQRYRGRVPLWHVVHRAGQRRDSRLDRGRADSHHRAGRSGRASDRPFSSIDDRHRPSVGRVDGHEPLPTRPAAPLRLSAPGRPGALGRGDRDRARLFRAREATCATCSSSRSCSTCTRF